MRVITISPKIVSTQNFGHEFQYLRNLNNEFPKVAGSAVLVGPKKESSEDLNGLLAFSWPQRFRFRLVPALGLRKDLNKVSKLLAQEPENCIHVYEGGVRELALVAILLKLFPKTYVVFNLNFPERWDLYLEKRSQTARFIHRALAKLLIKIQQRGMLYSETEALCQLVKKTTGVTPELYPQFASFEIEDPTPREDRKYLLTYLPSSKEEFELCIESFEALLGQGKFPANSKALIQGRWGAEFEPPTTLPIEVSTGYLSDIDYKNLYQSSGIFVLPYANSYYKYASSARLLDCASAGARAIVPTLTSLEVSARSNRWGVGFNLDSVEDLVDKISKEIAEISISRNPASVFTPQSSAVALLRNVKFPEDKFVLPRGSLLALMFTPWLLPWRYRIIAILDFAGLSRILISLKTLWSRLLGFFRN